MIKLQPQKVNITKRHCGFCVFQSSLLIQTHLYLPHCQDRSPFPFFPHLQLPHNWGWCYNWVTWCSIERHCIVKPTKKQMTKVYCCWTNIKLYNPGTRCCCWISALISLAWLILCAQARLFEKGDIDGENFPCKLAEGKDTRGKWSPKIVRGVFGVVMPVAALKLCINKSSMISRAECIPNPATQQPSLLKLLSAAKCRCQMCFGENLLQGLCSLAAFVCLLHP